MKLILILLTLVLTAGASSVTYSEQVKLTESNISDQLQQPTVSAIYRDREGLLWLGTQQGLYSYDGATLSLFNSEDTNSNWIPDTEIKDIAEDSNGKLLVATAGGDVLLWNRQSETFSLAQETIADEKSRLVRMLVSKSGLVWLLSQRDLKLYDPDLRHNATWLSTINLLPNIGSPMAIAEDARGDVWVGGTIGLARINPRLKTYKTFPLASLGLPEYSIVSILAVTRGGQLVIGTNTGNIVLWDTKTYAAVAKGTIDIGTQVYISSLVLYQDKIIIGTDRGLYLSDSNLSSVNTIGSSSNDAKVEDIYSLYRDGSYVWVGKIDGLDILSFPPIQHFSLENGEVSDHVLAFAEDNEGKVWIGTYSGLYAYDENARTHTKYAVDSSPAHDAPDDERIVTLAVQQTGLWIGLFGGGAKRLEISDESPKTLQHFGGNKEAVTKILVADEGNDVWIATIDHGLFRIRSGNLHSFLQSGQLPERSITTLFKTKTARLLVISGNKLYLHDAQVDQFVEIGLEFGLANKKPFIYSVAEGLAGELFIGTKDHGVFNWEKGALMHMPIELATVHQNSGLLTSTIYGIQVDSAGNLWCSTQNGIAKLSPDGKLIKRFTTADGLQGSDFTLGASFKSREGLIYFGGTNGYNRFNPADVEIDNSPSPMRLTGISFPSQDNTNLGAVARLKSLLLTHRDHFVTFQFSVLDFIDTERNQFRYKLENYNADWIENGTDNTATFANLPSGEYVFRAQGANSAGIWNREGISLNVTVLPAPWFTWWAYTFYALISACMLWGLHRIYRSYAIDRKSAELALEMFEAENRADDEMQEQLELQDEMVRSAHQHNLTTLKLVGDSIALRSVNQDRNKSSELAESSLERITALSSLENCLSYHAGGPVANLHKYTEGILAELLKHSPVPAETLVTINQVSTAPIPAELASPLSIVIYELAKNSVQHAFGAESPANYIHIDLVLEKAQNGRGENLVLTVHDSGHSVSKNLDDPLSFSGGLAIVKLITSKLRGNLEISQERGTTIILRIPYSDDP